MTRSVRKEVDGRPLPASEVAAVAEASGQRPWPVRAGEPAPWFQAATPANPRFSFDTVAGRRVILSFLGELSESELRPLLAQVRAVAPGFIEHGCVFFGVTTSRDDSHIRLFQEILPNSYLFLDRDCAVSQAYGALFPGSSSVYRHASFVLDERLRVVEVLPMAGDAPPLHLRRLMRVLQALPALGGEHLAGVPAPILIVPRVFEDGLCRALIDYYKKEGGVMSGFMRDINGQTVLVHDPKHKTRHDRVVEDGRLRAACMDRIKRRLLPEIAKSFQFNATRIERYLVACYEAENQGHFRAHRDNTTLGTAHRRFAVSLNLNTGNYQGGMLRFPEFGRQLYEAPAGGAAIFSCSLLHEATPVTAGCRYAFLPFLYDDAAAAVRSANKNSR